MLQKQNKKKTREAYGALLFLTPDEREKVVQASQSVQPWKPGKRLYPSVSSYKKHLTERLAGRKRAKTWDENQQYKEPIYLAEEVAPDSRDRIFHIYDSLIRSLAPLGCELDENLNFLVRGELVSFRIKERKDKIDHVTTKEDKEAWKEYEKKKKDPFWSSWAHEPRIRKYDHVFNGQLSLTINGHKRFGDKKDAALEDRLPDIILALYEESESVRQKRLRNEEEERQKKERKQRELQRRKLYNEEIDKVEALLNAADDYAEACKMRAYIEAVRAAGHIDEDTKQWLSWAEKKADWMDPMTDREDEYLGKREHTKSREEKKLKKLDTYGWGWGW